MSTGAPSEMPAAAAVEMLVTFIALALPPFLRAALPLPVQPKPTPTPIKRRPLADGQDARAYTHTYQCSRIRAYIHMYTDILT